MTLFLILVSEIMRTVFGFKKKPLRILLSKQKCAFNMFIVHYMKR